jgi:hypothetical protein
LGEGGEARDDHGDAAAGGRLHQRGPKMICIRGKCKPDAHSRLRAGWWEFAERHGGRDGDAVTGPGAKARWASGLLSAGWRLPR